MPQLKSARFYRAATIALSLGLAGCAVPSQHPTNSNDIVIGVAGPISGALHFFGEQEQRGAEMAVRDINAAGGLLGRQLWLAKGDDQCDPSRAESVAQDMVDQHAVMVVGHFCSGASIQASSIYAAHQMVQITPSSTNPRLTNEGAAKGWTTLFRVANPDDRQAVFVAKWLTAKHPHSKVAVLNDGSSYGLTLSDRLLSEMQMTGMAPALTAAYASKSADFGDLVKEIQRSNADIVFIGGYHFDFAKILRQARAAGVAAEFIGTDALNTSEFVDLAGNDASSVRFTDASTTEKLTSAAKVVAEFREANKDPSGFALASYAAVQAWAAGVTRAGSLDGIKVAAAIRSASVDTVLGKLSWDSKGDIEQLRYAWFSWRGGTYSQMLAE